MSTIQKIPVQIHRRIGAKKKCNKIPHDYLSIIGNLPIDYKVSNCKPMGKLPTGSELIIGYKEIPSAIYTRRIARQYGICRLKKELS